MRLVDASQADFNVDLLYGNEVSPERVLSIARSYPMMSEFRVVVVRDFSALKGGSREDGDISDLIPYLEQPNPGTILCLIDTKSPDKRTNLGKALTKSTHVFSRSFDKLPDYQLPEWTEGWVRSQYKREIEPGAARILSQLVGNDLQLLSTELEKVCTFVDTSEKISEDAVKKIIGSYREYSVIELKDALLERDLEGSLKIAEQMLLKSNTDTGEVIRTVGFLFTVFGNIWQIRRLLEKGSSKSSIQQELGIRNDWYFNQLWKDASAFSLAEMPQVFEALLAADMAAKGYSTLDTTSILLLLIKRITG